MVVSEELNEPAAAKDKSNEPVLAQDKSNRPAVVQAESSEEWRQDDGRFVPQQSVINGNDMDIEEVVMTQAALSEEVLGPASLVVRAEIASTASANTSACVSAPTQTTHSESNPNVTAAQATVPPPVPAPPLQPWKDLEALQKARNGLRKLSKHQRLDVFFRRRIETMLATLNLLFDNELNLSIRQASASRKDARTAVEAVDIQLC